MSSNEKAAISTLKSMQAAQAMHYDFKVKNANGDPNAVATDPAPQRGCLRRGAPGPSPGPRSI
jgi:hypothetical protein